MIKSLILDIINIGLIQPYQAFFIRIFLLITH